MIKKILNAKRTLEAAGYEEQDVVAMTKISTQTAHYKLRGDTTLVKGIKLGYQDGFLGNTFT